MPSNPLIRVLRPRPRATARTGIAASAPPEPLLEIAEVFRVDVVARHFEDQDMPLHVRFHVIQDMDNWIPEHNYFVLSPEREFSLPDESSYLETPDSDGENRYYVCQDTELHKLLWKSMFRAVYREDCSCLSVIANERYFGDIFYHLTGQSCPIGMAFHLAQQSEDFIRLPADEQGVIRRTALATLPRSLSCAWKIFQAPADVAHVLRMFSDSLTPADPSGVN